jgi:hypothetical protein
MINRNHDMDRTEIGNCIIAGITEGGTCLEQMSEIVTRLELAGWVIVPREPTQEMLDSCGNGECAKWAPGAWLNMIDAAVARS